MLIPRRAHWIWFDEELPLWAKKNIDTFQNIHPEWEIKIWRDLPSDLPIPLRKLIASLPWYSSRSDILRYWLLARYGGVYLDTDIVTLRSIEPLLNAAFFLAPCQPTGHSQPHLACAFMGSILGSRSASRILGACCKRAEEPEPVRRITYGPDLLTSLFTADDLDVTILPLHYFYVIPDRETAHAFWRSNESERAGILKRFKVTYTDNTEPYAVHLWGVDGSSQRTAIARNLVGV